MEAKNFRIGNWIETSIDFNQIEAIHESYVYLSKGEGISDYYNIKPIPLSEKWLRDLGFVKDKDTNYRWYLLDGFIAYDLDDNCIRINDSWEFGQRIYVHEIQNLFFAITGEEIKIDETIVKESK